MSGFIISFNCRTTRNQNISFYFCQFFCCFISWAFFISNSPAILSYCCSLRIGANKACSPVILEGLAWSCCFQRESIYHIWYSLMNTASLYVLYGFFGFFGLPCFSLCFCMQFSSHLSLIKTEESSICWVWSLFWSRVSERTPNRPQLKGAQKLPFSQAFYNRISHYGL